jgi:hypothetical protein
MKHLLFFSIGSHIPEARFYARLSEHLCAAGYRITLVTLSRKEYLELQGGQVPVVWMRDELHRTQHQPIEVSEELARLRQQYQLSSLRRLWSSDLSSTRLSTEAMEHKTIVAFQTWERLLKELTPDVVISDFGGELLRRTLPRVAREQGIQNIYLDWSPIQGTFGMHANEVNRWDHLRVEDAPLTVEAQSEIDSYLANIRQKRLSPVSFWTPEINSSRVKRLLTDGWRELVTERNMHDQYTPLLWFREYLSRVMKLPKVRRWYSEPQLNEPYFFFPLHHALDSQLTVRAPAFYRQEYFIDWIARALPDGYTLYVKEHPRFIARYGLDVYTRLANTPRVRLISPYHHPHDLIKQARAIVTINSTAGFEALLYHKPVVVCGPVSYRGHGATIDVEDINNLPARLDEAIASPPPTWKIDRFLWSMMQASYPGKFYDFSTENVATFAASIMRKLTERAPECEDVPAVCL